MRIYKEVSSKWDFDPWSGAVDNFNAMTEAEFEALIQMLEDCNPEGITETELNDILWFEDELIAEICGYSSYEEFFEERMEK